MTMKIGKLLKEPRVVSLPPDSTVQEAVELMVEGHCGSVLVTGSGGELLGIFTERDLLVRVVSKGRSPRDARLEEVMTTDLYTTDPNRYMREVRREMGARHVRHVPVLEGDKILAVLSMRDLMRASFEEKRKDNLEMTKYIRGAF